MDRRIGDVTVSYVEHGEGMPLLALHGAGVDHRELEGTLEPILPRDGIRDGVAGLALLCPIGEGSGSLPAHRAVVSDPAAYNELDPSLHAGFDRYFVVRTAETARRYRDRTVPGIALVDQEALERVFGGWELDLSEAAYSGPTLIVAGRADATAGYATAVELVETYPRSTIAVIDDVGHALMHERPEVVGALLAEWLQRVGLS